MLPTSIQRASPARIVVSAVSSAARSPWRHEDSPSERATLLAVPSGRIAMAVRPRAAPAIMPCATSRTVPSPPAATTTSGRHSATSRAMREGLTASPRVSSSAATIASRPSLSRAARHSSALCPEQVRGLTTIASRCFVTECCMTHTRVAYPELLRGVRW